MPRNIVIDSAAIVSIVAAAFFDSGGLKAGTPFETASTPVIAVQPFENAVRSRNRVSIWPVGCIGFGDLHGLNGAAHRAPRANSDEHQQADDEEICRQGEDPSRLADAAEIAEHDHEHESEGHLDAVDVPFRKRRRDRRHARRDADGDRQDVVDQERARGDERRRLAEIVLRDDVRAAAAWIGVNGLAI